MFFFLCFYFMYNFSSIICWPVFLFHQHGRSSFLRLLLFLTAFAKLRRSLFTWNHLKTFVSFLFTCDSHNTSFNNKNNRKTPILLSKCSLIIMKQNQMLPSKPACSIKKRVSPIKVLFCLNILDGLTLWAGLRSNYFVIMSN